MKNIFALFLILLTVATACRKGGSPVAAEEAITPMVVDNDLSNQHIKAFAEDSAGHVWIGTFRGLNKYNVHEIHHYFCTDDSLDLPDNQVNALLRDSRNRLWVATI